MLISLLAQFKQNKTILSTLKNSKRAAIIIKDILIQSIFYLSLSFTVKSSAITIKSMTLLLSANILFLKFAYRWNDFTIRGKQIIFRLTA